MKIHEYDSLRENKRIKEDYNFGNHCNAILVVSVMTIRFKEINFPINAICNATNYKKQDLVNLSRNSQHPDHLRRG